jgi:hypothetical protein
MKISIALSLLILGIGAVLGWQDHQRYATVRKSHDKLAAEAAKVGIVLNAAHETDALRVTRRGRLREDNEVDGNNATAQLISFAKELKANEQKGGSPDKALEEKITKFLGRMMALDPAQLKIIFAEISANPELENKSLKDFIAFSVMTLASDHPQTALMLFTESPDFLKASGILSNQIISTSLAKWAEDDPAAALKWVHTNVEKFPDLVDGRAKHGMITGAAVNDPRLAFKLIAEFGIQDSFYAIRDILGAPKSSEQRTATLAALLAHLATLPEGELQDKASKTAFCFLGGNAAEEGFEAGSKWLENAALTSEQLAEACEELSYGIKREESGQWIEWISAKLPVEKSRDRISQMVRKWTEDDYQAAGKWLVATPAGPTKNISIRSYAETVAKYEPETAAQWAMTLPADKDRDQTLKNIYQKWPANDEAAKQAFKKLHGIN